MAIVRKTGTDIQELIERSAAARATLAVAKVELKQKLDVAGRVKESLSSKPAKLLGGTLVAGFLAKKMFFGKPKRPESKKSEKIQHLKKERGMLMGLFLLVVGLAKPVAKMYAGKLLKNYLENRFDSGVSARPQGYRKGHY